jgi:hypothetical protein
MHILKKYFRGQVRQLFRLDLACGWLVIEACSQGFMGLVSFECDKVFANGPSWGLACILLPVDIMSSHS